MRSDYRVAIIGGGASGLLCAVELLKGDKSLKGTDVVVFEKNDRIGKKLIATGNGQGNLSNTNLNEKFYHGDKKFINSIFSKKEFSSVSEYFSSLGIPLFPAKDGKLYPLSKQASSVLDTLRSFFSYKNLVINTNEKVNNVNKINDKFKVNTDNGEYICDKVVLAFGGSCGKQFGTDGTAYVLAEKFGHKTTKLIPSLVQLKTETQKIKGLKNLKENACVSAFDGKQFLVKSTGDVLFTDYGVSGNAIFNVSSYLTETKAPKIIIEFLPDLSNEQTEKLIEKRLNLLYVNKEDVLCGLVNKKIGQAILKTCKKLTAKEIANALKNFTLDITGNLGFNYAQVTKGGIDTSDISVNFESKLCSGLYILGEALNVDGDCGGYNLNFAFASGIICAKDIKENL